MDAVLDTSSNTETGVPAGAALLAFVDAIETDQGRVREARQELRAVVGKDGVLEAAATAAVFNGLIRVADGTGIQLDDGLKIASAPDRAHFGINNFAGAASTVDVEDTPMEPTPITSVRSLFG